MKFSLPKMELKSVPDYKILINVGAGLDIPTGEWVPGVHGESILNGGVGSINSIVGKGNVFKSTLLHYITLSAASRIDAVADTRIDTHDTETNISPSRLVSLSRGVEGFKDRNIIQEGIWNITDKSICLGNVWFEERKKFLEQKAKLGDKLLVKTPILSFDKKTPISICLPTFNQIDSLSEFQTEADAKMQEDNELGDSGANTAFLKQNMAKTRLLSEIARISTPVSDYSFLTAHINRAVDMNTGPVHTPPDRKLQMLKHGDKLKGVSGNFTFLCTNVWYAVSASPLINKESKSPEYPSGPEDDFAGNTDLQIVTLKQLRGKSGPTGMDQDIVVSQKEGVLPTLTEFHFIKSAGRFGIEGNNSTYNLIFCPDIKISRNTVRRKIKEHPELARAINLTSELLQMHFLHFHLLAGKTIDAKQIFEILSARGYDWNILLSTRGYWVLDTDKKHPQEFLSTMDVINMCLPTTHPEFYVPYWYDKSTLKLDI